jgi:hypothetical protein
MLENKNKIKLKFWTIFMYKITKLNHVAGVLSGDLYVCGV